MIAASLREENVDNRHIKKSESQQENRYPTAQAIETH
jgi:hypothetical protein